MALVKDFITFKQYVRYNFSASDINSLPDTAPVEREFILPVLGNDLYTGLQQQVDAKNVTQPVLLDIVRAAIVPLTVYKDLPFLQVQLGDTGLRKLLSENSQGAFRWEFNEVKDTLEDKGCKALDQLLVYLYANKDTLSWTAPEQLSTVFKTGAEFNRFYTLKYPARTFLQLLPVIADVEEQYITYSIGKEFLLELMQTADPQGDVKDAVSLVKKSVANLTVMKAIEKMPVKVTPYGLFTTIGDAVDDVAPKDKLAGTPQLEMQRNAVERDGESYLQKLLQLLQSKASATVFATFFASDYYQSPSSGTTETQNNNRKTYPF